MTASPVLGVSVCCDHEFSLAYADEPELADCKEATHMGAGC